MVIEKKEKIFFYLINIYLIKDIADTRYLGGYYLGISLLWQTGS